MPRLYSPVKDALLYLTDRMHGNVLGDECTTKKSHYPQYTKELNELYSANLELVRLLDGSIRIDRKRLKFFFDTDFRKSGDTADKSDFPLTYTAANVLFGALKQTVGEEFTLDDVVLSRRTMSSADKIRLILRSLELALQLEQNETYSIYEAPDEQLFFDWLSTIKVRLPLKRKITDLYRNFAAYTEELAEILRPIVEIISENTHIFENRLRSVEARLPEGESLSAFVSQNFNMQIPSSNYALFVNAIRPSSINVTYGNIWGYNEANIGLNFLDLTELLYSRKSPDSLVSLLKILSDKTRFDILKRLIIKPAYGLELAESFSLTAQAISYHMNKLMLSGLICCRYEGSRAYYYPNKAEMAGLIALLSDFFELTNKLE